MFGCQSIWKMRIHFASSSNRSGEYLPNIIYCEGIAFAVAADSMILPRLSVFL
jgi:hypothetical protein